MGEATFDLQIPSVKDKKKIHVKSLLEKMELVPPRADFDQHRE